MPLIPHRRYPALECGICGQKIRYWIPNVIQCIVCLKPLCKTDNYSGFCKTHYSGLSPADQVFATQTVRTMESGQKKAIGILFGSVILLLVGFFQPSVIFLLAYMLTGSILLLGAEIYSGLILKKARQVLEQIGLSFREKKNS